MASLLNFAEALSECLFVAIVEKSTLFKLMNWNIYYVSLNLIENDRLDKINGIINSNQIMIETYINSK